MRTREAQRSIRRGMKLLDGEIPKWRRLIDLDELDLGDPCQCIIGQIYGDYEIGLDTLGLDTEDGELLGFGLDANLVERDDGKYESEYEWLTDLWREVL